jgi:hypothetical protein
MEDCESRITIQVPAKTGGSCSINLEEIKG